MLPLLRSRNTTGAWLPLLLVVTVVCLVYVNAATTAAAAIHGQTRARLPGSLRSLLEDYAHDRELEGDDDEGEDSSTTTQVTTACLLTSRSVTATQKQALVNQILSLDNDTEGDDEEVSVDATTKAVCTNKGLVLALPGYGRVQEVTGCAAACSDILYHADTLDYTRGEGLYTQLGPAMEQVLSSSPVKKACPRRRLVVILNENQDVAAARLQLERSAEQVLAYMIVGGGGGGEQQASSSSQQQQPKTLRDVFDAVLFCTASRARELLSGSSAENERDDETTTGAASVPDALSRIDAVIRDQRDYAPSREALLATSSGINTNDWGASRIVGPVVNGQVVDVVERVQAHTAAGGGEEGTTSSALVSNFGQVCAAELKKSTEKVREVLREADPELERCAVGQLFCNYLQSEGTARLGDLFHEQIGLLREASFEQFRKDLNKLRVSPNLPSDMQDQITKSAAAFVRAAKKLLMPGAGAGATSAAAWSIGPARQELQRQMKEFCSSRLLAARASGQFKPLPRKGVTVGMHWLLPKPFGNDFRQEPWMVHATDNMVYIPKNKLTNVNEDEVREGDWRSKIVPSPVGNDLLFMQ